MSLRRSKLPKFIPIVSLLILLVLGPIVFSFLQNAGKVEAAWVDDNFSYRNAIPITSHTAAESNVYVTATIDTSASGQFQADCGDLRFTTVGGDILPYYIVSGCVSASTVVHVFFKSMPAGAQTIYYYYGNPSASNGFSSADFATQASSYAVGSTGSQEKGGAPIAYWKFDDGTGTNAKDSSSNGATGTITNAVWKTDDLCLSGKCLYLDGTGDYIDAGDKDYLDFSGTSSFSLSVWVKPTVIDGTYRRMISKEFTDGSGRQGYLLWIQNTALGFERFLNGSRDFSSYTGLTLNTFSHVVATYDGSNMKLYVNGNLVNTGGSSKSMVANTATIRISGSSAGGSEFAGYVDEPKIYNYARTAAQIKSDFKSRGAAKGTSVGLGSKISDLGSLSNGLVGYWKMDEVSGAGSTLADSSGNSNTGTAVLWGGGNTSTDSAHVAGKFGNSFSFDGGDDYITPTSSIVMTGAGSTLSLWFKVNAFGGMFVGKAADNDTYIYPSNSTTINVQTDTISTEKTFTVPTMSTGTWYHLVVTRDNNTTHVYLNGTESTSGGQSQTQDLTINQFGRYSSYPGYWYNGMLDELRLYNRALSPREVRDLYNWAPGPVGYWNFEEKTGTTTNDVSGNGNTGTFASGANAPTWTDGKYGSAISTLNGTQYSNIINESNFDFTNDFTISTWIYVDSSNGTGYLGVLGKYDASASGWDFGVQSNGVRMTLRGTSNLDTGAIGTLGTGVWRYVTFINTPTSIKTYIDGILINTTSGTWTSTTNNIAVTLGNRGTSAYSAGFKGKLDEVKIYNYARNQKQIVEDMNAGHPVGGSPVGSQIGYWKMDEGYGPKASSTVWNQAGTTTNLITNPSFETNLTSWNFQAGGGAGSFVADTTSSVFGSKNSKFSVTTVSANYPRFYLSQGALSDGVTYTVSWYGKADTAGSTLRTDLQNSGNGTNCASSGTTYLTPTYTTSWTRYSFTFTFSATNCPGSTPILMSQYPAVQNYYFDGFQIEASSGSTPYCDGTVIGNGSRAWNGTAHASTSTCTYGQDGEINGPTWTNNGKYGKALSFDGNSDYVKSSPQTDFPAQLSFSAWINPTSAAATAYIFDPVGGHQGGGSVPNEQAKLYMNTNRTLSANIWTVTPGSQWETAITTTDTVPLNQWSYVSYVFDGTKQKIYINGRLSAQTSGTTTGTEMSDSGNQRVYVIGTSGENDAFTSSFTGQIDEVKIYSSALTEDEIKLDYNRGQAMVLGTLSDTSGLTGGSVASSSASALYCLPGDTATCTPPVGEWNFEESTGNPNDSSGNGNNGAWNGTGTHWADGKLGRAGNFNGTNDYVNAGTGSTLDITNAVTMEAWVYLKSTSGARYIGGKSTDEWILYFPASSSTPRVYMEDVTATSLDAGSSINLNQWYHIAFTYDKDAGTNNRKIYINGSLSNQNTATGALGTSAEPFLIGAFDTTPSNPFNGYIDGVKIFNYARTAAQVAWDYNQGKPIAQWKMDECQGASVFDASGNGNTGTITIGATGTQTAVGTCTTSGTAWYNGVTGKFNSSLNFDGTDDYVQLGTTNLDTYFDAQKDWSVSTWAYINGWNDEGGIFSNRYGATEILRIMTNSTTGRVDFQTRDSGSTIINQNVTGLSAGSWYHFVLSRKYGGNIVVYVNGVSKNSQADSRTGDFISAAGSHEYFAGRSIYSGDWVTWKYFNGQIDDVRIYNYALTATQVKSLFNGGSAIRFGPTTGSP